MVRCDDVFVHRFFQTIATLALAWGVVSCAAGLRKSDDIGVVPEGFNQKMEAAEVPTVPASGAAPPVTPASSFVEVPKSAPAKAAPAKKPAAKNAKGAAKVPPPPVEVPTWNPTAWPYGIGEKIVLVLRYGPLEGGIATMEVKEPQKLDGETVLHFSAHVKSSKVLELFYKVDDTMDTWVGIGDHLPRRQEIRQLESSRWGQRVVLFKQDRHAVRLYSSTNFPDKRPMEEINREDPMTPFAQDVFGALYFYRFAQTSERINFPIHDRYRNWANELTFLGKERIKVPAGEFDTLHFKMFPRVSGQLAPKGDVEIWVMDDPTRVMVQFKAKIKVGSITGELKEFTPGRTPAVPPPRMKTPIDLVSGSK